MARTAIAATRGYGSPPLAQLVADSETQVGTNRRERAIPLVAAAKQDCSDSGPPFAAAIVAVGAESLRLDAYAAAGRSATAAIRAGRAFWLFLARRQLLGGRQA
jgi:hypothetical protein